MSTYADFQNKASSEKIGLAVIEASQRLMGWELVSGSLYSLSNFDQPVISTIEDSGTAYTEVFSQASVTASKYYYDRSNHIIYLRASDSSNPNSRYLVCTFKLFFANSAVNEAHDLSTGYAVEWIPQLKPLSEFGVELDNVNQLGVAIEGSGSIKLYNDPDYWRSRFDKYYFENNRCFIYSWNRDLPITEAKIIFRGRIQSKAWSQSEISFAIKDFLNELRAPVITETLADLTTSTPMLSEQAEQWLQRRVYGYKYGFRPSNIDQAPNNELFYDGTGTTWTVTNGSATVTLSSGSFLGQDFILEDQIRFEDTDDDNFYTIQAISGSTITLDSSFAGLTTTSPDYTVKFARPETVYNRRFYVCSHLLREISTTVTEALGLNRFYVADPTDIEIGDNILVNSEPVTVSAITGSLITTNLNLSILPSVGTTVVRQALTNVRIGDKRLAETEYTISNNGEATLLTLDATAEFSVAPQIKLSGGNVSFSSGSSSVTGTNTFFKADIQPRDWIRATTEATYYQVASVESDTALTLRSNAGYTKNEACILKSPAYYDEGNSVVSCDVIGLSVDGTTSGALLKTGPGVVKDILTRAGLSTSLVGATFDDGDVYAPYYIGIAIPERYDETKSPTVRDTINKVNQSIFGSLVQNEDFQLEYAVFRPTVPSTTSVLREHDILSLAVQSSADKVAKTVICEFGSKEYDPGSLGPSMLTSQTTSDMAQYLARSTKEYRFSTVLKDRDDALSMAQRMAFVLEVSTSVVKIKTKLQAARLQVTDKVQVIHDKLYERFGSTIKSKIASIQSAKKSHSESSIEMDDLANAFARCARIAANTTNNWDASTELEKMYYGFITDAYGMQDNDPDTYNLNLIW